MRYQDGGGLPDRAPEHVQYVSARNSSPSKASSRSLEFIVSRVRALGDPGLGTYVRNVWSDVSDLFGFREFWSMLVELERRGQVRFKDEYRVVVPVED